MKHFLDTFPVPLIHLGETDSTNRHLRDLCNDSPLEELTTVVTEFQTAGRGQRGNTWESEPNQNLLFSFVLYPTFIEARHQFLLSQLISLAIKETFDEYAEGFSIKWPNDIYWKEKKIGGILIEHDLTGSRIARTLVGIGLNINQQTFHSPAPNPVSLQQITHQEHNRLQLLAQIMKRVKEGYQQASTQNNTNIKSRYHEALFRKEGLHHYKDASGLFLAKIVCIEPDGMLVLQDEQHIERTYAFKEVSMA